MLIIVNSAFDDKNSDDDDGAMEETTHFTQEIELALISVNTSINSSNGINESPIDAEELDTSDNNTTNNTQTTAECDDKLLQERSPPPPNESCNGDDDDSNSKDNYDMNYDDYDENLTDEMKRKHNDEYDSRDVQNVEETHKLVNGENGVDLEDCDYYSDGDTDGNGGVDNGREEILKFNHNNGDGIIANQFIGLYYFYFHLSNISLCVYVDVVSHG